MVDNFNASWEGYFILLGFSKWPHLEVVLFVMILIFYLMTLTGNLFIIILSYLDSQLHTPMYFFLSNLSALDLCYTTSSVPQLLFNLWGPEKTISYSGCMLQLYFVLALGTTDSYGAIACTVLRMQSTTGLQKVFGTCGAHLTVVSLFFIPIMCIYLQPPTENSQDQAKFIALFYTVVTPSLNPLIYTLRNKDVRGA
ncbi:hypothetical protein A6R68_13415, partial [Neotoma lepida]